MYIFPYAIVTVALSRLAGITSALGLVPALTLPSQIAKACVRLGSTTACKSRSLTPTRFGSLFAIVAALVLLRTPGALAVTPLTDFNIRTAATAWIDDPAITARTYGAISEWDVSAVSNMAGLFFQKPTFNADIGKWNVARVSTLNSTFLGAAAFNQDIGRWNMAALTTLFQTFNSAAAFNRDIGKWNVASVATLYNTFGAAAAFNQDIGKWNIASVTTLSNTFNSARAFNADIGKWNTVAVTTLSSTFSSAAAFNREIGKWNVASVANLVATFNNAAAFNQEIGRWSTASVRSMLAMFTQAASFKWNVARWNVLSVTDFSRVWLSAGALSDCNKKALYANWTPAFRALWPTFNDIATCTIGSVCTTCITDGNVRTAATSWLTDEACANTTYGSIGDWNTAAVSSMASLFASRDKCAMPGTNKTMFNSDISNWNVVGVSTMAEMFSGAAAFDQPIGKWSTASVSSMASMFAGAAAFNQPVSWNVMSVTSMAGMFNGAAAFNGPIGGWSTASVTSMAAMFRDASKFNQPIGGWNVAAVSDMGVLLSNARAFGQNVAAWNVQRVTALTGAFDSTSVGVSCAVYNAWGSTLQMAYPATRAACLCDTVKVQMTMAANADTGANSTLQASVPALPQGTSVSLSALLRKEAVSVTVEVRLATYPGGSNGSVHLPSTGTWEVQLSIDKQACPSQPTNVTCMVGFVDTQSGGCECPIGYENIYGVCTPIDPAAVPKTACQVATFQPDPAVTKLTDNSTLNISFTDGRNAGAVKVILRPKVALRSATASNTAALLGLGQVVPGEYEVELEEAGSRCTLRTVTVGCSEGYVAAGGTDGTCIVPTKNCTADEWPDRFSCRQKADMIVQASSGTVQMTVVKSKSTMSAKALAELRLKSGNVLDDVDHRIRWTASVATPSWLTLNNKTGDVHSSRPVAEISVVTDLTGLNDTALSGPLVASITFTSRTSDVTRNAFVAGPTDVRSINVSLTIEAVPYVEASDVTVTTSSGVFVGPGDPISAGDQFTVTVKAFDAERMPISRSDRSDLQLNLRLRGKMNNTLSTQLPLTLVLDAATGRNESNLYSNVYTATVPAEWIRDPEPVQLIISSGATSELHNVMLTIVDPSRTGLIFGSIAAAVLSVLLVVMLILARRNRDRMKEVVKNFLKLEIRTAAELLLDVWDIYGDSFTFSTMLGMQHKDWVQSMLVPWIIFFALAAVASAFSILSKLHFFVSKMRTNFARRSHLSASAVSVNDALYQNDFNTRKIYAYANMRMHTQARGVQHTYARFYRYMVVGLCEESVSPRPRVAATAPPVTLLPMQ